MVFDGRNRNWIGAALSSALRVQFDVECQNEDLKALCEHIGYDISCIMDTLAEVVHAPVVTRDGATLKYVTHTHTVPCPNWETPGTGLGRFIQILVSHLQTPAERDEIPDALVVQAVQGSATRYDLC